MATGQLPAGWLRFSIRNYGASPPRACVPSVAITPFSRPRWCISSISNWSKSKPCVRPLRAGRMRRTAFLGLAAYLMKRLLIHHARPLSKRAEKTALPDFPTPDSGTEQALLEIDDTLNRLAAINPALRRVVELRVFEGLTREEIAREMGCGTATVARHWTFARNWLEDAFTGTPNQ